MSPETVENVSASAPTGRVRMFAVGIDPVTMPQAIDRVWGWVTSGSASCRYVVTPNVDHAINLQQSEDFRQAYEAASLVIADGWPLVAASRLLGSPLPERVAGSDLVPKLFARASVQEPLRVFLLGGMPGVPERAAERVQRTWSGVEVVGISSPPLGFERSPEQNQAVLDAIRSAAPDLLVVGLGAPKQELWLLAHHEALACRAAIAAGATIDFLAGEQRRAPRWVQRVGMEWLFRVSTNPTRLAGRYLRGAWRFPLLVGGEFVARCCRRDQRSEGRQKPS